MVENSAAQFKDATFENLNNFAKLNSNVHVPPHFNNLIFACSLKNIIIYNLRVPLKTLYWVSPIKKKKQDYFIE